MHSCLSILTDDNGSNWIKKDDHMFDVTMGSYMGAEVCDLVGLLLLQHLQKVLTPGSYGIYCEDGLAVLNKASSSKQQRISKKIREKFNTHGFKIVIEKGLFETDFLDISVSLREATYLQLFH